MILCTVLFLIYSSTNFYISLILYTVPFCINYIGIQQGNQYFAKLAIGTIISSAGFVMSLNMFGDTLEGVWASFAVFNTLRLLSVIYHHFYDGPLAKRNIEKVKEGKVIN